MWCNFLKFLRFYKTIKDIGLKRLYQRLVYEFSFYIDSKISDNWKKLNKESIIKPIWKNTLAELNKHEINLSSNAEKYLPPKEIEFTFLNKTQKLIYPFQWNNKKWSRLWQFNLHYFDWSREWIENSLKKDINNEKIYYLSHLIDEWIKFNKIGFGDGWHSYTTSLRIRNWVWIFRLFPELNNSKRLESLWVQLCWLHKHPEICHGGNHWLENLIAQIIVSLQFDNIYAEFIYKDSIKKLKNELKSQILLDGGHEERSAAYHILILDRLVELGWVVQIVRNERPSWILNSIKKMTKWLSLIRISNGEIPRFNDSSPDLCPDIDKVREFSISYINNNENNLLGIRGLLSKGKKDSFLTLNNSDFLDFKVPSVVDLKYTGWIFIRPQTGWEFIFKSGPSCPKHLPAHAHSDLFSFDLFKNGIPIISETGTSIYGNSSKRKLERSGASHNVLRLAKAKNISNETLNWIEPVDVWGSFRAGRKAKTLMRSVKKINDSSFNISCSHDGYKSIQASYKREIILLDKKNETIELLITDRVNCIDDLIANVLFHFGPNQKKEDFKISTTSSKLIKNINYTWKDTYFSLGFGRTLERKSLIISFNFPKGSHLFQTKIKIPNK